MAEGFQKFSLDQLSSQEGVNKLNDLLQKLFDNVAGDTENTKIIHGYGSPEGVITAGIGSKYLRVDGGAGTTNYTKESGTGNTGWVAEYNFTNPIPIANGGTGSTTGGNYLVPSGGIIIWSGSSVYMPTGWYLCDGSNGTPDLRDKFIVGAGYTYSVGASGGATTGTPTINSHTLTTAEIPSHSHTIGSISASIPYRTSGTGGGTNYPVWVTVTNDTPKTGDFTNITVTPQTNTGTAGTGGGHTHTASSMSILPPYYALCYIMKS